MERVTRQNAEAAQSGRVAQAKFTSASRESEQMSIDNSPLMVAQREKLNGLFSGVSQRQGAEEEEALQGKFESVQRVEEEEALQGKFETAQRAGVEEEEPLQGKFEPAQRVEEEEALQGKFDAVQRMGEEEEMPLQGKFEAEPAVQREEGPSGKPNDTGLPDNLKSGVESLSGVSMDSVKVHYNSPQPAQLNALAYAQGTDIHVAPGQEKHLPHEAWHVVQQAQGRVKPTMQMKEGVPVNDDTGLEQEADVMGAKAAQMKAGDAAASPIQMEGPETEASTASDTPVAENAAAETVAESAATESATADSDTAAKAEESAAPAPEEASKTTEELSDATNPEGQVTTQSGMEIKGDLPPQEKIELVKKGDQAVSAVSSAATIASGTDTLVTAFEKSKEPAKEGMAIFDKTNSMFGSIFDRVTGFISGLIKPIVQAGLSILGMKEKWAQWTVFKNAAVEEKGGKTQAKADAPEEAKYGLSKIPSGFMRHVKDVFLHVVEFTSTLLTMIPGAQIVGGPMKLFSMICNLVDSVYKAGKSIYQKLFGEKKDKHSGSLLDKALGGDQKALQLILDLKLGSIAGSGYTALDLFKGKLNSVSLNNLAHTVGVGVTRAERIIDKMKAGGGGPASTEELHTMLHLVCARSAASKELIRNEIKETMTGFGK